MLPQRLLLGPGPSPVPETVLEALATPTIGHLDPAFLKVMDGIRDLQQYLFRTQSPYSFTLSAPGSAAMEACLINLVHPGESVIVGINGAFGKRMQAMAERSGAVVIPWEAPFGSPLDVDDLRKLLATHPEVKAVAFVHAETSTGVRNDAELIAKVAKDQDALVIADTVTSLGGIPVEFDAWNLDAAFSGSQKCLSCVPGIAPITLSEQGWQKATNRAKPLQSWFFDFSLLADYWQGEGKRPYHHTAPVNSLIAWHRSLELVRMEGLENAWKRHAKSGRFLREGLAERGWRCRGTESTQLPQLTVVDVPEDLSEEHTRTQLRDDFDIEIGAGLAQWAGKVWRIGLMGHGADIYNVDKLFSALDNVCYQARKAARSGA